jgi:2'-5' RNA ligase
MRLFVAAYPPVEAADDLARRLGDLRVSRAEVNTRPARRETWHVTLAFLGDVPDDRAPAAATAVEDAAAGLPAPTVRLAGGGSFGRGRFTVLWVGVDGDLDELARRLRRNLKQARLPYDRKPFRPHLTIARPGDRLARELIKEDRAALATYRGPAWPVRTVDLVRSRLGPAPTYEHLAAGHTV